MKKQLLMIVLMMLPLVASADAVEIDGIYYNLISKAKIAEVTINPHKYIGAVVIPEFVTYENIDYDVKGINGAFFECKNLTSVTIPNSVTSIGNGSFWGCYNLTTITIPNSVTSIGEQAFYGCRGLTSINIGNSITNIGYGAFTYCSGLTSVNITDIAAWCKIVFSSDSNPLSYAHYLYLNGKEVKNLVIPNSITKIEDIAFWGCSSLISVTIPQTVTSIGSSAFSGCSSLASITIPNSVTSIGDYAFSDCRKLTSVTIPNSVTSIGGSAFCQCNNLTSVTIGTGIQNINSAAFGSCPNITDVYCYTENVPTTQNDAFNDSYIEHVTLHVPATSVNSYKGAIPWSGFKSIVALTDSDPKPTGIDEVRSNTSDVRAAFFDLNGRKLNGELIQKGVYIQNGKKIIVK